MFIRFSKLKEMPICSGSHTVGNLVDLLYEPHHWFVRYLVVELDQQTVGLSQAARMLLSPVVIDNVDTRLSKIHTNLDVSLIRQSPLLRSGEPVTREHEKKLVAFYRWPIYWLGKSDSLAKNNSGVSGTNLRSGNEISNFLYEAPTGKQTPFSDFLVSLKTWSIEYATTGHTDERGDSQPTCQIPIKSVNWVNEKRKPDSID